MPQDVDPPKPVARVFKNFMPVKNKNGKTVYVPKGTDLFLVHNYPDDYNYIGSNHDLQEIILVEVANGKTVTKVAEDLEIPFSIILDFSRRNEDFGDRLNEARRYRAESYHDKIANIADVVDEGTSKSAKVKTEIYKHLMAVGDRDRFGSQQKIVGDPNQPVTFLVDTGIRRDAMAAGGEVIVGEKHVREVSGKNSAGTDERMLALDSSTEQEGIRPVQDGATAHSTPPGLRESDWSDPTRKAGTPPMRHARLRESSAPSPGDEPRECGRQDGEEAPLGGPIASWDTP